MVQYIPGPEQLLAPAAGQLMEGVLNFLNPNRQFQQAVQASIAQNPQLAQQFADIEASSPGFLKSIGIGRLASIPPTPTKEFEIRNRQAIVAGKEAELGVETAKNLFTTDQIQRAVQLIRDQPDVGMDAALKMVTGQTFSERSKSQLEGKQAEAGMAQMAVPGIYTQAGVRAATGQTPGELAKDQFYSQAINTAQKMMAFGPRVTMQKLFNNEYTNEELLAIFSTPLGEALKTQIGAYMDELRISMMADRQSDALQRLREAQAFTLFGKLNDPNINLADVFRYLQSPDSVEPQSAQRIQQGLGRLQEGDKADVLAQNRRNLVSLLASFNKFEPGSKGDEGRELSVAEINSILAQNARIMGTKPFTASFEVVPRGIFHGGGILPARDRKELVFRSPEGEIVPPGVAFSGGGSTAAVPSDTPQNRRQVPATQQRSSSTVEPLNQDQLLRFKQAYEAAGTAGSKAAQLRRWETELSAEHMRQIRDILGIK